MRWSAVTFVAIAGLGAANAGCKRASDEGHPRTVVVGPAPADTSSTALVSPSVQVAIGSEQLCVRFRDGRVRCRGGEASSSGLVPLPSADAICVGYAHACALVGGAVWCWGSTRDGVRGPVSNQDADRPNRIAGLPSVAAVACGRQHTCARDVGGTAHCWGYNVDGRLGNGTRDESATPVAVSGVRKATGLATGGVHTCVMAEGGLSCWGGNDVGQLGRKPVDGGARAVAATVEGLADVAEVALGHSHACARRRSGEVLCWGWNVSGQLGIGTKSADDVPNPAPKTVEGLTSAVELALGHAHSCARRSDGSVWCWGANDNGQLGDGTRTDRVTPVQVQGVADSIGIAAGSDASCAVRADDTVLCWGDDRGGKLGAGGAAVTRATPLRW